MKSKKKLFAGTALLIVFIGGIDKPIWNRHRIVTGMIMTAICSAVFILTRQPYAGIICFSVLIFKGFLIIRKR